MKKVILASTSPRRQAYFKEMGLRFECAAPDVDETPLKDEKPRAYVARVATLKALEVKKHNQDAVVVAGDTTVALGRRILGKPENAEDAERMLKLMSGRRHKVLSTVCVVDENGQVLHKTTVTTVKVKQLSESDIQFHLKNAENWQGKAGAYGIQTTAGGLIVRSIIGSHSGVVGLPLVETKELLVRCGVEF